MKKLFVLTLLLLAVAGYSFAQDQNKATTITGKVISFEESFALEGVSIQVKGTGNNSGTQADGTFSISIAPESKVLVFTLAGYQTQEINITTQKDYEVILKRNNGYSTATASPADDGERSMADKK